LESAQEEVMRLQEQDKVVFYQPCVPKFPDKTKRQFVIVIHEEVIKDVAKKFSKNNIWALNINFKTNQYDLLLYMIIIHS